jgi:hypothetical protein
MDYLNKFTGGGNKDQGQQGQQKQESGGRQSEQNEDMLDKGELLLFLVFDP